jgi:hypothetical protein
MPRRARQCPGGIVYHVWNRAAGRLRLFKKPEDFSAFNRILLEAHERHPIRILDWCLMPNHWHFVVCPEKDGEVTAFFKWLVRWFRDAVEFTHTFGGVCDLMASAHADPNSALHASSTSMHDNGRAAATPSPGRRDAPTSMGSTCSL